MVPVSHPLARTHLRGSCGGLGPSLQANPVLARAKGRMAHFEQSSSIQNHELLWSGLMVTQDRIKQKEALKISHAWKEHIHPYSVSITTALLPEGHRQEV